MEWDLENSLQGFYITIIVCVVSGVLYCMFRNTLFAPRVSVNQDPENIRRKKKNEVKKSKKIKKVKILVDSQQNGELEADRTQTTDDTTGEEDERLSDLPADSHTSSSSERPVERLLQALPGEHGSVKMACQLDNISYQMEESYFSSPRLISSQSVVDKSQSDDSDSIISRSSPESNSTAPTLSSSAVNELQAPLVKSKRSKRRSTKRSTGSSGLHKETLFSVDPVIENRLVESLGETTKINRSKPNKSDEKYKPCNSISTLELNAKIEELEKQLKVSESKLGETSQLANSLAEENERFLAKEEETSLGLQVLQMQYTELLRSNKAIEHQKNLLDRKLKSTENEKCDLLKRLDKANADALKVKADAELELCKLREQLTEKEAQLTAMAAAMAVSPPSMPTSPIPELVRTQELAQAMSKDNCLLKSRIEQLDSEVSQLRQTNMRQQQDLQVFRAENHKLHTEKESALEELRAKRKAEQSENDATRMELNLRCRELELEKQKNQELSISLSEVRAELSRSLQQEKRHSGIIGSLEYQFAELNAQQQRLLESANQSKVANEAASSELRAQVVNLSNDLMRVTSELNCAQHKVNELTYQLESANKSISSNTELNGEPVIVNIKTEEVCVKKEDSEEDAEAYKNLRSRLSEVESNFAAAEKERVKFYNLYQAALADMDYYKSTLQQTEEVLSKLEKSVKEAESRWYQLLSESEQEQNRLRQQIIDSQTVSTNVSLYSRFYFYQ
ncbi:unnamed protein product [Heterobilharzia americana]|nr:unnamed protein product [Heterobilharzia americana]